MLSPLWWLVNPSSWKSKVGEARCGSAGGSLSRARLPFLFTIQYNRPDAIPGSAPYSGPKAAQVFVGPMAGCAGGQSARAGGSWLLLQLARSSAVQRHIIALEAELEPGLWTSRGPVDKLAVISPMGGSGQPWSLDAQFLTNTAKCTVKLYKSITVCPVRWTWSST